MMSIFQRLYNAELNARVSWFWDGGFEFRLGDEINGVTEFTTRDWEEGVRWLEATAVAHYPLLLAGTL